VDVKRFEHQAAGVDWHCEQRGDGPPVVLVPSGEGDCTSFEHVAAQLADEFTVLTFDTPGFSRSHVQTADDVSVSKLAPQIAGLVESLGTYPTTFYGGSSGGFAVLDLAVRQPELVRDAVVHEVANTATVTGDNSFAFARANSTATVTGDGSTAFAGPADGNTATVTGNGLDAVATGDGTTVVVP